MVCLFVQCTARRVLSREYNALGRVQRGLRRAHYIARVTAPRYRTLLSR